MDWPKAYAVMRRLPLKSEAGNDVMKALAMTMARLLGGR